MRSPARQVRSLQVNRGLARFCNDPHLHHAGLVLVKGDMVADGETLIEFSERLHN